MPIKTFRGLLTDGSQETINLHTITGKTGYRIVKLQIIAERPGHTNVENLFKVWSAEQTAAPDEYVNFGDMTLLAVAYYANHSSNKVDTSTIIFDNIIFNQDIFITHKDIDSGEACNYHIELEQIKLDSNETAVATLKNIKNRG